MPYQDHLGGLDKAYKGNLDRFLRSFVQRLSKGLLKSFSVLSVWQKKYHAAPEFLQRKRWIT